MQKADPSLKEVWNRWEQRWEPGQDESRFQDTQAELKGWLKEWSRIVERNGTLYRAIDEPGLWQVFQLLMPYRLRSAVIEAGHDQ